MRMIILNQCTGDLYPYIKVLPRIIDNIVKSADDITNITLVSFNCGIDIQNYNWPQDRERLDKDISEVQYCSDFSWMKVYDQLEAFFKIYPLFHEGYLITGPSSSTTLRQLITFLLTHTQNVEEIDISNYGK